MYFRAMFVICFKDFITMVEPIEAAAML